MAALVQSLFLSSVDDLLASLLELIDVSPVELCNPADCPLFLLRKMDPLQRLHWFVALDRADLEYLAAYHHVCMNVRLSAHRLSANAACKLISINEQIDDTPTGRLPEGMIESIDEFYSANLGQDTRRGMKENAQRGFLNDAPVAFGYRDCLREINGTKKRFMEVNETEAPIVRRVFYLFLEGEGAKSIAQQLNAEGFRTRHGEIIEQGIMVGQRHNKFPDTSRPLCFPPSGCRW